MTPNSPKIIHDWVSTAHFCREYENQAAQELAFQFVRGKSFVAYKIQSKMSATYSSVSSAHLIMKYFQTFWVSYES